MFGRRKLDGKSKVEEKAANAKASTELQLTLSIWKFIAKL